MDTANPSAGNCFLEITERDDLGTNLIAPQNAEGGSNRYRLITETTPGDVVLHYHRPSDGIVGMSRVAGPAQPSRILWAAKGASSRGQNIQPYWRPAWEVPLVGYTPLDPPLHQSDIINKRLDVFSARDDFEARNGKGQHFPYYRYGTDELRTFQGYMAIYPDEVLQVFPNLRRQVVQFAGVPLAALQPLDATDPADPALYLANEDITINHGGTVNVDPEALQRATRQHAELQNQLRQRVLDAGRSLVPLAGIANVDLSWKGRGRTVIAEVKSLTLENEEHQLRYGLGQLLDYMDEAEEAGHTSAGVLFVARPPRRISWVRKCDRLDVQLCWPGRWPRGL